MKTDELRSAGQPGAAVPTWLVVVFGDYRCALKPSLHTLKLDHMHMHAHGGGEKTSRILRISLVVTAAYIVLLVVAGIRAHSLALLSEAGHNLSDFFALLLSLVAVYLQSRPPSSTKTYGYHRAGVLAALVNAVSLVAVSGFIFYEASGGCRTRSRCMPA